MGRPLPVVSPPAHGPTRPTEDLQHHSDDEEHDSNRPKYRRAKEQAEEQTNKTHDDHWFLLSLWRACPTVDSTNQGSPQYCPRHRRVERFSCPRHTRRPRRAGHLRGTTGPGIDRSTNWARAPRDTRRPAARRVGKTGFVGLRPSAAVSKGRHGTWITARPRPGRQPHLALRLGTRQASRAGRGRTEGPLAGGLSQSGLRGDTRSPLATPHPSIPPGNRQPVSPGLIPLGPAAPEGSEAQPTLGDVGPSALRCVQTPETDPAHRRWRRRSGSVAM